MAVQVINRQNVGKFYADQNKADVNYIFRGDAKANLESKNAEYHKKVLTPYKKENWVNSAGCAKLYDDLEKDQAKLKEMVKQNAAQAPTTAQIEAILGKMFIDITRRAQEAGDLTGLFAREVTDLNADKTVTVVDYLKYRGKFEQISGANDSVPLIEQALGNTDTFGIVLYALGWKDSLANMLYNRVHTMEKVNQAAAEAYVDLRNSKTIGRIVDDITFVASQKQAADTTTGATPDYKRYETLRKAINKLRGLKDPQTGKKIVANQINILCNSNDTWDIQRVINGQLTTGGANGTITTQNVQSLPINTIVEYDYGIGDGFTWGEKTLSFNGVTQGTCYIYVPNTYWLSLTKRPLTLETGSGSVLQLSTEEKAWYTAFGQYDVDFFGASHDVSAAAASYGSIIEVTLP
jgi:hypothetical protein